MRDQLLGTTQPVLSISLEPGDSIIAEVGGFAWMTDSIAMAAADDAWLGPWLCVYTATGEPSVVAFAGKLPGRILSVEVGPGYQDYLVRESSFAAGTPGIRITAEAGPPVPPGDVWLRSTPRAQDSPRPPRVSEPWAVPACPNAAVQEGDRRIP